MGHFYEAASPAWIREQEIGKGPQIRFARMTSCIGFVARVGGTLIGAHLPMEVTNRLLDDVYSQDPSKSHLRFKSSVKFNPNIAAELKEHLPESVDEIAIVGCVDMWQKPANGLLFAYQKLQSLFGKTLLNDSYDSSDDMDIAWSVKIQQHGPYSIYPASASAPSPYGDWLNKFDNW